MLQKKYAWMWESGNRQPRCLGRKGISAWSREKKLKCAGYYVDDCSNGICPALNLELLKKIFTPMRGRYAPRQMRKRVEIRLLRAARLLNQIYQIQGNRAGRSQSQKQSALLRRIPQRIHQLEQNLQINQKKPCTK